MNLENVRKKCFRIKKRFENNYSSWLDNNFNIPVFYLKTMRLNVKRHKTKISDTSIKIKLKRTNALRDSAGVDELTFVTKIGLLICY